MKIFIMPKVKEIMETIKYKYYHINAVFLCHCIRTLPFTVSMWHSPVGPGSRKFLSEGEKSDSILQCEGKRRLPQELSAAV